MLLHEASSAQPTGVSPTSRRGGTIALELQSAYKFALAVALGVAAVWADVPVGGAAALLMLAVILAARALSVLAHEPSAARTLRPREHAVWDGGLSASLAVVALVLAASGSAVGAGVSGVAAVLLATLRLRTRYVAS